MSKIETQSVRVTKTIVRYTPEEYQEVMVAAALAEAGVQASSDLGTHVRVDGDDVVVELMVEVTEEPVTDADAGRFTFARPEIK